MLKSFRRVMLTLLLCSQPLSAAAPPPLRADASRDVPRLQLPSEQGPWVVRAYFDHPRSVRLLLRRAAPWNFDERKQFLTLEVANRFEYQRLLDEGFAIAIDQPLTEKLRNPLQRQAGQLQGISGFECYRTVEESFAAAEAMALAKPQIAEIRDIGDSWAKSQNSVNGYDLKVLRLTNRGIAGSKPVHYLQGALHAREYVTAETVLRYAQWLVSQHGVDPDVTWVLDQHEIHILLQANPDGRKIAEGPSTRFQRKNRNLNFCVDGDTSIGVDLNRNFPFDWGGPNSSPEPCFDIFRGPSVASEVESQAIIAYVQSIFPDQRAELPGTDLTTPVPLDATGIYMDVHSNAAANLFSWGNSGTPAPNATQLLTLARKLSFYNGYFPEPGAGSSGNFAIGGTTDDFVYATLGVPAFTIELDGDDFFPACAVYESSIVQKNLDAFWIASRLVRAPLRLTAGPELSAQSASPTAIDTSGSAIITVIASDQSFGTQNGVESAQNIAAVEVFLMPPWQAGATALGVMSATDGSLDSSVENLNFNLSGQVLGLGRRLVYLQSIDAAGHRGPVAAVFVTRSDSELLFADGFE